MNNFNSPHFACDLGRKHCYVNKYPGCICPGAPFWMDWVDKNKMYKISVLVKEKLLTLALVTR